ncbi:MAG: AAA family ATPase [Mesorhizobium sp.]|nr:MAG: AAA family ATPase [Mesorhizobium sp.]
MTTQSADEIFTEADRRGLRRVLIVTAIALEMRSVRAHMQAVGDKTLRNHQIVELGIFSSEGEDCLVVVAESRAGNLEAQASVIYPAQECGPFDMIVFVGVAGSRKKDIPIGSVVASSEVYYPYSGKYEGGEFNARTAGFPADQVLVQLATKVERDGEWVDRIRPPLRGTLPSAEDYPKPHPPGAVIAPIVSVEAVSADATSQLEVQISKHCGDAQAVEMEGYGALFAARQESTPAIIIRGISDAREGKEPEKDAIYQPVAAAHAAAFAFELVALRMKRYPTSSLRGRGEVPVLAPPPERLPPPSEPQQDRVSVAFSFAGQAKDFPPERCQKIAEALRHHLDDDSIELERTESGSFHMIFSLRIEDVSRASEPALVELLSSKFGARLTSVVEEDVFTSVRASLKDLEAASRELLEWSRSLPDGTEILRPELDTLLAKIEGPGGSTTALLGEPGAGKSALLATLARHLRERHLPFLAIKADLIDPSVADEDALRVALGLDQNVTTLLSGIARMRPVVLIIDQLDALATYVDLKTGRLNLLLNIIRRLGGADNVHVVVSSRTFEYEHDTRLKTVRADSLHLDLPAWSTVLEILERNGVKAAGWPADAQRLMRFPQTLKTYLSLLEGGGADDFTNYQKLLDRLWKERILAAPNGGALSTLTSRIAEDMAEHENLWVPSARYATEPESVAALIAAGVLTDFGSDSKVGFTHQTLFEHALARSFAEKEGRLSAYVLGRQASLFIRPKAWAGLSYLRNVDPPTYASEIEAIWNQADRRHLKFLFVEFLGSQTAPTEVEVSLMRSALSSSTRRIALQAIQGSPGWFERLQHSAVREAMTTPDEVGIATMTLIKALLFDSASVLKLMRSVWLSDKEYDGNIWAVLQELPRWTDAELEMAVDVIKRTDIADFAFEHAISAIGAEQPEIALKLTLARLDKQLTAAMAESASRAAATNPEDDEGSLAYYLHGSPSEPLHKLLEQSEGYNTLDEIARTRPEDFLSILWPWLQRALGALRDARGERSDLGYAIPYGVDPRFEEEKADRLGEHALLAAFTTSLDSLAAKNPAAAKNWILEHQHEDSVPAHRLFAHTLALHADELADFALTYLMGDVRRLHLGDISDGSGTTRRLVEAAAAHWSDEQIRQFSDYVGSYSPSPGNERGPKQRRSFIQAIEHIKLQLLRSLPTERLTKATTQKVAEGVRKFGERRIHLGIEARWIGSPMSADSMSKAKDEEILNAFKRLPDATDWDNPRDWRKGGNVQLSREFANFAKANPHRAFKIIAQLDPEFGTRAAGYALAELGDVTDPSAFERIILDLESRGFGGEEYRGSIARGLERILLRDEPLSDEVVELLSGWLGKPSDSPAEIDVDDDDGETLLDTGSEGPNKPSRDESVLWGMGGLSVLPHGNFPILEVLARIYLQRKLPDQLVALLQRHLDHGDDVRVWGAMLRFMQYVRPEDPSKFHSFLVELFRRYPSLQTSREVAILLAHLQWLIPDFVKGVLLEWEGHQASLVQQARGELAGLISVVQPQLSWATQMVDAILEDGLPEALTGVAYAAVNLWPEELRRRACVEILKRALPRADDRTWSAIIDLFRIVDDITPTLEWLEVLEVIAPFIEKHSPVQSTFIVDRLQTLLPDGAELVGAIASALVATWKGELGDTRTATAGTAAELVDISITLHRLGPATRERGTDLFEDLLEVNAYTARETLEQIDNRFRGSAPTGRRRLPRRTRRAPRRSSPIGAS